MQLHDYFEFEKFETKHGSADRIRVKGTRIDIELIVFAFKEGLSPERIQQSYPSLNLEQTYAAITYYLHNKMEVEDYIQRGNRIEEANYAEYLAQEPSPVIKRLRALKAQQQARHASP